MTGWFTHQLPLLVLLPGHFPMSFNVALCFFMAGIALVLPGSQPGIRTRWQQGTAIVLVTLGGLAGFQNITHTDLGVDQMFVTQWFGDADPHPGRMAPLTSLGFVLAAGCFLFLHRLRASRVAQLAVQLLVHAILAIGIFGLVGYSLKLELLYGWYRFARTAPLTALGFILLGGALWMLWFRTLKQSGAYTNREDKRIAALATLILFVLAFTGGLTGFVLSTQRTEAAFKQGLEVALANRTQFLETVIGDRVKLATALATDPALLEALQQASASSPAERRAALGKVQQRFLGNIFAGMAVLSADGQLLVQLGHVETLPPMTLNLRQDVDLLWNQHALLQVNVPVTKDGQHLGTLVVQRALPAVDKLLADARLLGATGDIAICAALRPDRLRCLPSPLVPRGYLSVPRVVQGKLWPAARALDGQSGVAALRDGRGEQVMAAYGPVPGLGLGIVVKQDTTELYGTIRAQLADLLVLLSLLVASSLLLLRSQLLPLVTSLLEAKRDADMKEAKIRSVFDNVADGLVTLDELGTIESLNPAAAAMFGYAPQEVVGKHVNILLPERLRQGHTPKMTHFRRTGEPSTMTGTSVESVGLCKNGSEFPIQISIREMVDEGNRMFVGIVRDVSERKHAEQEMRAAEERFRLVSQATNDMVWDLDFATGQTWWNEAVARLGYGPADGESEPGWWRERIHPADRDELLQDIHRELESGCQSWAMEYRFRKADGSYIHILDRAYIIRDGAGHPTRAIGAMTDVTERKLAEARQRQSEVRFFNVFNLSPVPIMITRVADGRFLDVNDALLRLLGYQREELIGSSSAEINFWPAPEERAQMVERIERQGSVKDFPMRGRATGGALLDLLMSVEVVDLSGESYLFCFLTDITERKRAEEALRESEEKFRSIVETTNDWIWWIDAQGRVLYANPAVEDILGYQADELLGTNILDLLHEDQQEVLKTELTKLVVVNGAWDNLVMRWRHKDGSERYTQSSAVPILSESGELMGYRGSDHDITLLKRYEQELEEAKLKAEAANQAKSEFLANMSHEIRTPMNGVIGLTSLVLKTSLSSQQREYLELMKSSADSLLRLLNDILDFSKMEARKLELDVIEFDLREAVGNTLKTFAASASDKGVDLTCDVAPEVPALMLGDPGRLAQIIVNLTGNALKFTKQGEVVVRLAALPQGKNSALVHITVSDSGIGMSAEQQANIFMAFAQADSSTTRQFGGTGLGLSIVSQLVNLMDGTIRVESELGKGTTFHLTVRLGLPQQQPAPIEQQALALKNMRALVSGASDDAVPLSATPARTLNVLIAEDHPVNQILVSAILNGRGHSFSIAKNGLEVLQLLDREGAQPFDLILMDGQMPEMDGYQATVEIRRRERSTGQHLHIIALTANAMKDDREKCIAAGMDDYVTKPIDPDQLLALLEAISLAARRPPAMALPAASTAPGRRQRAFDLDAALKRTRGKRALLKQLADLFLQDLPVVLAELQGAVAAGDARAVERSAHRLRGAAFTVSAAPLAEAANSLELMGRNGQLEDVHAATSELQQRAAELATELEEFTENDE
jgi:PAS domain S-box-containing protein